MSKNFLFGHTFQRDPVEPLREKLRHQTTTPAPNTKVQTQRDEVSALYELGLLSKPERRPRTRTSSKTKTTGRHTAATGDRVDRDQRPGAGGARVAGSPFPSLSQPQKSTQPGLCQFHPLLRPSAPLLYLTTTCLPSYSFALASASFSIWRSASLVDLN